MPHLLPDIMCTLRASSFPNIKSFLIWWDPIAETLWASKTTQKKEAVNGKHILKEAQGEY